MGCARRYNAPPGRWQRRPRYATDRQARSSSLCQPTSPTQVSVSWGQSVYFVPNRGKYFRPDAATTESENACDSVFLVLRTPKYQFEKFQKNCKTDQQRRLICGKGPDQRVTRKPNPNRVRTRCKGVGGGGGGGLGQTRGVRTGSARGAGARVCPARSPGSHPVRITRAQPPVHRTGVCAAQRHLHGAVLPRDRAKGRPGRAAAPQATRAMAAAGATARAQQTGDGCWTRW